MFPRNGVRRTWFPRNIAPKCELPPRDCESFGPSGGGVTDGLLWPAVEAERTKKADVARRSKAAGHVGLLANQPLGPQVVRWAELLFI
jgi:hypothetical protein